MPDHASPLSGSTTAVWIENDQDERVRLLLAALGVPPRGMTLLPRETGMSDPPASMDTQLVGCSP